MVTVRSLSADEWGLWRALRLAALAEAPDAFSSTLADWSGPGDSEARWRARLDEVPYNVVALVDGEAAGMASGTAPNADSVELISMWVAPRVRGRSVGDALIAAVVEWGRRNGARRVALDVMSANIHALRLYERNGFRLVDAPPANATCEFRMEREIT